MSHVYKPVGWDRPKIVYDLVLILAAGLFITLYIRIAPAQAGLGGAIDLAILRMRAFGLCAYLMLSVILCIGPLARLDPRFLPLLYNRRHFGVLTATIAAAHVWFVLSWYFQVFRGGETIWDFLDALLSSNVSADRLLGFPFELFGAGAFAVLTLLALTSHDFWLRFLTPAVWKSLHMLIYPAYALVAAHLALGYLQDVRSAVVWTLILAPAAAVAALHLAAARREAAIERQGAALGAEAGWAEVPNWREIAPGRARIVAPPEGERVAVFRHGAKLCAISNVCAHQQGPLGEGRILDGCVTCPWHGFQFDPETGRAPPPFTDKVATYRLKRAGGRVLVACAPEPLGATTPGLEIAEWRTP